MASRSLPLLLPLPLLLLLLPLAPAQPPDVAAVAGPKAPVAPPPPPPPLIHIDSNDDDGDAAVVLGSTRRLTCYSSSTGADVKVVWYKNGAKIDSSFAVGESPAGQPAVVNEMQFRVVTSDIGATYECRIHAGGQERSATVQLDVIGPPIVDGYEPGRQLTLGEPLNLTCQSISGGPGGGGNAVSVAWYRRGARLAAASEHRTAAGVRPPRVISTLSVLADADATRVPYTCRVSHPKFGHYLEADINLLVSLPFTLPPVTIWRTAQTTEEHCKVSPLVDFVFILDSSSSIKPADFRRQKQFVKDFVEAFDVDAEGGTRFGVVQFGTKETLEFHLGAHATRARVLDAVERIRQTGVETYLDRGLRFYREQMRRPANGARLAARSVAIIITDGDATDKDAAHAEAKLVRATGAEVWAIGVGEVKKNELLAVTASPARTFFATGYEALKDITGQFVEAAKKHCERATPPPPTQPVRPPPGAPRLLLYTVGDPVIMGEDYEIECMSPGGDEMSDVVWYKDDVPVDRTHRHEEAGAYNHHRLRIDPSDSKAVYTCRVFHPLLLTHSLNISFVFPIVGKPKIVGYERGRTLLVGSKVSLVCFSVSTAADVAMSWLKNGRRVAGAPPAELLDLSIIGELEVTVSLEDDLNEYSCQITNPRLPRPLTDSIHLDVMPAPTVPPPGRPKVHATPPDWAYVGVKVTMTCTSEGADPGTALSWYKNGVQVDRSFAIVGNQVVNTYAFEASAEDIGARYDCLVENGRTNTTQRVNLPYEIKYRPAGPPTITGYGGAPLEPNSTVTLTCRSETARPDSRLIWYRGDVPVATETRLDAANDFAVSELRLTGAEYVANGAVYTCQLVTDGEVLDPLAPPPLSGDDPHANVTLVVKVHGGWSNWSTSTPCSVTCGGGGTATYVRRCDKPEPKNGGDPCQGPASEARPCSSTTPCPTPPPSTAAATTTTTRATTTTTAAPTQPPAKGCDLLRGPLDVALAVDSSDSVYERDFLLVVRFLTQLAAKFNVTGGHQRIGAMLFGRSPKLVFPLGQHAKLADLQGALQSLRQRAVRGDSTNTAAALRYARHVLFGGAVSRPSVPRLIIVITDAHSHDPQATAEEARRMRAAGILTVAMGIGVRTDDQDELQAIAGSAARVLQTRSYGDLPQLLHDLPAALRACKMPVEPCKDETDDDDLYPDADDRAHDDRRRPGCPASCRDSRWRCAGDGDRRRTSCGSASRSGYCRHACGQQDRGGYGHRDHAQHDDYGHGESEWQPQSARPSRSACFAVDTLMAYNGATLPKPVAELMKAVVDGVSRCTSAGGVRVRSRVSLTLADDDRPCDGALCGRGRDGGDEEEASTPTDAGRLLRRLSEENGLLSFARGSVDDPCCHHAAVLLFLSNATSVDDVGRSAEKEARDVRTSGADLLVVTPRLDLEALAAARRLVSTPSAEAYWYFPEDDGETAMSSSLADAIANRICRGVGISEALGLCGLVTPHRRLLSGR